MDQTTLTARVETETVRQLEMLAYRRGLVTASGKANVSQALRLVIDIGLRAVSLPDRQAQTLTNRVVDVTKRVRMEVEKNVSTK